MERSVPLLLHMTRLSLPRPPWLQATALSRPILTPKTRPQPQLRLVLHSIRHKLDFINL